MPTKQVGPQNPNMFYDTYKNAGPSAGLVTMAILIGLCAVPGNCMNLFLVYLTIKHKSLRGSSNYLLALNSFYEFLHQTGHYIFLFTILSGRNFISPVTGQLSDTCTPINLIYNYNMVVCIITFVLYVLLALFVWKNVPQQSENSKCLVRSLSAICGLLIGSYFFNTIIRLIVVDWLDPIQLWYVNVAGGVLVNIGAAANTPILFIVSIPYRTLIKQELRAVWPSRTLAIKPPKPNQVAPF
uniref:G_PROTEIN_RECEP_F1_2 domain-containing protein n=1 Tax=Globodera pallida TaxID=36090 RepID=A0A183CET8_GLOPA